SRMKRPCLPGRRGTRIVCSSGMVSGWSFKHRSNIEDNSSICNVFAINELFLATLAFWAEVSGPLTLDNAPYGGAALRARLARFFIDGRVQGKIGARFASGIDVITQGAATRLQRMT